MEVEDPMNILKKVKWNAKTNIIEIDTYCEGDAYLHIVGENNQTKTIKVEVRCKGETNGLGAYSTTSRSLSELYRNTLVVHRKGVGTWICNEANPTTSKKTIKITPAITNPQKGSFIEAKLSLSYPDEFSSIKDGKYKLYIQDVKERYVVHRKGVGTWICNEANPTTSKKTIKITPAITNPQKGSFIEAKLSLSYPDEFSSIKDGKYKLYIQDVKERYVVLVGRGFKLIIPYEKR